MIFKGFSMKQITRIKSGEFAFISGFFFMRILRCNKIFHLYF